MPGGIFCKKDRKFYLAYNENPMKGLIMNKLRSALEARIQAMPGSDTKKQIIVDAIIYSAGAAAGIGLGTIIYKAGQKSVR